MTVADEAERARYPRDALLRFKWNGEPFVGRVMDDDPEFQRVRLRIYTRPDRKPQGHSMITVWVHYRYVQGFVE